MLAAEFDTLPEIVREKVVVFFEANRIWLAALLERGRDELALAAPPGDLAQALVAGLEGAMLLARVDGGVARFRRSAALVVAGLIGSR
jgi:TetR/AcrR family transcriptional repressor of nem operon